MLTPQWGFSKGLDSSCPIGENQPDPATFGAMIVYAMLYVVGPILVSPSVVSDPQALSIKGIYNETVVQDGHTRPVSASSFITTPIEPFRSIRQLIATYAVT